MNLLKTLVQGNARNQYLLAARIKESALKKPSKFELGLRDTINIWYLNKYLRENALDKSTPNETRLRHRNYWLHRTVNTHFNIRTSYIITF